LNDLKFDIFEPMKEQCCSPPGEVSEFKLNLPILITVD
jgi:hypothetical protein